MTTQLLIDRIGDRGEGLADDGQTAVRVRGALPREQVEAGAVRHRHNWAPLIRVVTPHPQRIEPDCPHYGDDCRPAGFHCGGCHFRHVSYSGELELKRQYACRQLEGLLSDGCRETQPEHGPADWYRNKMTQHVVASHGVVDLATRDRVHSRCFGATPACRLLEPELMQLRQNIREALHQQVSPEDIWTEPEGWLRAVQYRIIANGEQSWAWVANLAVCRTGVDRSRRLVETLQTQGLAEVRISVVAPDLEDLFWPPQEAAAAHLFPVRIGAWSGWTGALNFLQVNTAMAARLYAHVVSLPCPGAGICIDAYGGIGLLSLALAERFQQVVSVEVDEVAVRCGARAAAEQGLANCTFLARDAARLLSVWNRVRGSSGQGRRKLLAKSEIPQLEGEPVDRVLVDPPRAGLSPQMLKALTELVPADIVYVSCSPASLGRDLKYLLRSGYRLVDIRFFDLFPRTMHLETVAHLVRG